MNAIKNLFTSLATMSSSNTPSKPRKSSGRRKVEIQKMENEKNLQVTFSKRRSGLFKKANEICTLTGAEVGIVVFSPSNKSYSFGHPHINIITERFQQHNLTAGDVAASGSRQFQRGSIDPTKEEYLAQLEKQVELEKARKENLKKWAPSPATLQRLSRQQLSALRERVAEFGKAVASEAEKQRATPQGDVSGNPRLGLGMTPTVDDGMPIPSDDEMPIPYDHWATGYGDASPGVSFQ